ncbi:hypothetical protein [Kineococcus sp. SYSU DK004]|uniref:hypothetical protein n=1 Tax=Kineococcus sp. SYSU DK004 TaxID=3383125 RepID=UPI003D7E6BB6
MMKSHLLLAGVAAAGAVAFSLGGASTNAISGVPATTVAGYGESTITGGTVTKTEYKLSSDGKTINSVELTFSNPTDFTGLVVRAAFNGAGWTTCTVTAGVAACPVSSSTTAAESLNVLVTDANATLAS